MLHVSSTLINRLRVTKQYSKKIKLKKKDIERIKELKALGLKNSELAKLYSVANSTIWRALTGYKQDLSGYNTRLSKEAHKTANTNHLLYKKELYLKGLIQ